MAKRKASGDSAPATATASQRIERQAVQSALAKLSRGQQPNATERAALKRYEAAQEADRRRLYYRTTPKGDYQELSGRSARVLIDQARRYGLPYPTAEHGPKEPVNLYRVLSWWHDLLAEHGQRIGAAMRGEGPGMDPLLEGPDSPALERYREERAKIVRLERLQKEGNLLPRDSVHDCLGRIANVLRSAGELLARQFGDDARALLDEALDDCAAEIEKSFAPPATVPES